MVNTNELNTFLNTYPKLFHMAQSGSWSSIKRHGLLSTTRLLDLYDIVGKRRVQIEECRRPNSVKIADPVLGEATIRDQKPMTDSGLEKCLLDGLTPKDWYKLLNERVFFWLTEDRLRRLLNAAPYRKELHDVIVLDARKVVERYYESISLSPLNTGCTKPFPHPRGKDAFLTIDDYPFAEWVAKRRGIDPVVELSVAGGVLDIEDMVVSVSQRCGDQVVRTLNIAG